MTTYEINPIDPFRPFNISLWKRDARRLFISGFVIAGPVYAVAYVAVLVLYLAYTAALAVLVAAVMALSVVAFCAIEEWTRPDEKGE